VKKKTSAMKGAIATKGVTTKTTTTATGCGRTMREKEVPGLGGYGARITVLNREGKERSRAGW
jgi:hypothetical protein